MSEVVRRMRQSWNAFFFKGYSVESLGALRVAIGLGFLLFQVTQFFPFLELDAEAEWLFLEPIWYFELLGFERLQPVVCWSVLAALFLATCSMTVGNWTRTSIAAVLVCSIYLKGARDSVVGDTHHRLLIWAVVLFFLLLSDCGRAYSVDARRRPAPASEPPVPEWRASWPIRAMQLYTVSFYLWSVIAKLRVSGADWLAGGGKLQEILLRRSAMWGLDDHGQALGNELAFWLAHQPRLLELMGGSVLLMEAAFPLVLFMKRDRARALFLAAVAAFHVANFVLLYVGFLLMPLVFVIFFDMDAVAARARTWAAARRLGPSATRARRLDAAASPAAPAWSARRSRGK
ncbi:MAG: HTTM domain-containing protein [Myxococcales bacterium]|nr:HTTM domain-containing protein [Myxococcales bacterium]MCB9627414.1 HTTM domain-containing protein [Sandaracinaceae bacterium]